MALFYGKVTIERKNIGGIPISATNIRECIKAKDFTALQKLVPKVTLDLINASYGGRMHEAANNSAVLPPNTRHSAK